jgi:hypothetical protein
LRFYGFRCFKSTGAAIKSATRLPQSFSKKQIGVRVGYLRIIDDFGFALAAGEAEPIHPVCSREIQFRSRPLTVTDAEFRFIARGAFSIRRMVAILAMHSSEHSDAPHPIREPASEAFPVVFATILHHRRFVQRLSRRLAGATPPT